MTDSASISYSSANGLSGETIGRRLAQIVARYPDGDALVSRHQGVRLTWRELGDSVEAVARGLLAAGIEKGDRVGIWSPNCVEWTQCQLGAARVGAILVNVNPAYRANELTYALRHSGVRVLVTARAFKSSDYLAMLAGARGELPALERIVTIDGEAAGGADDLTWDELLALGRDVRPAEVERREETLGCDDPINIQYTSGTTGNPKGATLTHHNILGNAVSIAELLRYTNEDRVCIPVPLYHCFGMGIGSLGCLAVGATMVYPAPSFEPQATLEAVSEERCTSLYGVPTMFIAELEHPDLATFDLSSLRTGLMGGAPCPIEVMKRVVTDMHAEEICVVYGMTETSPVSFLTRPDDDVERRVSTVGTVTPNVEAKIVDPVTGLTVPRGTTGEVCTRGYLVMLGYWNDPDATAAAIDPSGWMHTGDLGVMDAEGYLNIVGRMKDMVIRGGENLYPREIEEVLFQHPAVASVQVIGVPDERMGEELMAWIILREDVTATDDDVRTFCRERLAHFKVPRYVKFVDDLPMTVTGKVQKFRMREMAIDELGLRDRGRDPDRVMASDDLIVRDRGPITEITLNRPDRRNALSLDLMRQLTDALNAAEGRVIVLAGAGPCFSSGHDLGEMVDRPRAFYDELFETCATLMETIPALPQPVIAKVHGVATAAGCQLVASCDLAIAERAARFATPGVKIGLFCSTPMVPLSRAIGRKRSMEMLLTGEFVDAATAAEWGLVNRVVEAEDLDDAVTDLADTIAAASGVTVSLGKAAFHRQVDLDLQGAYALTSTVMADNATLPDAQEGITAFLDKRPPVWSTD